MGGALQQLNEGKKGEPTESINIIPGFETYIGSLRSIKHIADEFGANYTMIGDHSDQWDMPAGEYEMFAGGTKIEDASNAINELFRIF